MLLETLNKLSEEQLVAKNKNFGLDKLRCHVPAVPIMFVTYCIEKILVEETLAKQMTLILSIFYPVHFQIH